MKKLFGTDGIRGKADQYPFDDETLRKIGLAAGKISGNNKNVLIARDTRESGERITRSLAEGLSAAGAVTLDAGVLPTPAVSYFLNHGDELALGIMISASHNPYMDNGIKIFNSNGHKLSDEQETEITKEIFETETVKPGNLELKDVSAEYTANYIKEITARFNGSIKTGLKKIVLDNANGATFKVAEPIFSNFAEKTIIIHDSPDGKNINHNCGSTHLDSLKEAVLREKADLGIAFDGDGDRALMVDNLGNVVDGDHILAITTDYLSSRKSFRGSGVVTTVMANYGLEKFIDSTGVKFYRTNVGDRYVWQKMLETDSYIGGEQSGHIIFRDIGVTGDGIVTALKTLEIITSSGISLAEYAGNLVKYPQVLYNLYVKEKVPVDELPNFTRESDKISSSLSGKGRLIIRYSGTEDLLRIMVEGENENDINSFAKTLASIAEEEINGRVK